MLDTAQLDKVHQKLQQLLKQHQLLQKENMQLKRDAEKAAETLLKKSEEIIALQQKIDVLKLNTASLYPDDKVALKKRIEGYLSEIDKCMAIINAQ